MLRVAELKQYKQDLETNIAILIREFENKTDVKVDTLIMVAHQKTDEKDAIEVEVNLDI